MCLPSIAWRSPVPTDIPGEGGIDLHRHTADLAIRYRDRGPSNRWDTRLAIPVHVGRSALRVAGGALGQPTCPRPDVGRRVPQRARSGSPCWCPRRPARAPGGAVAGAGDRRRRVDCPARFRRTATQRRPHAVPAADFSFSAFIVGLAPAGRGARPAAGSPEPWAARPAEAFILRRAFGGPLTSRPRPTLAVWDPTATPVFPSRARRTVTLVATACVLTAFVPAPAVAAGPGGAIARTGDRRKAGAFTTFAEPPACPQPTFGGALLSVFAPTHQVNRLSRPLSANRHAASNFTPCPRPTLVRRIHRRA